MATTREPFEPKCWYHVFNHARGNDILFDGENDYYLFLKLISKYIEPVTNIYAYCLMPNHFHFLVRIKDVELPAKFINKHSSDFISHQWGMCKIHIRKRRIINRGKEEGFFANLSIEI